MEGGVFFKHKDLSEQTTTSKMLLNLARDLSEAKEISNIDQFPERSLQLIKKILID